MQPVSIAPFKGTRAVFRGHISPISVSTAFARVKPAYQSAFDITLNLLGGPFWQKDVNYFKESIIILDFFFSCKGGPFSPLSPTQVAEQFQISPKFDSFYFLRLEHDRCDALMP
ncbi:hypothetical protein XENORESO_006821 [Xenotaenia resolanae]|uniref:Uncharacterized protein n=1 Tax=Xenotaenia resolanae TaxID=208358 RepID=A0ABV0W9M8_9TELE